MEFCLSFGDECAGLRRNRGLWGDGLKAVDDMLTVADQRVDRLRVLPLCRLDEPRVVGVELTQE